MKRQVVRVGLLLALAAVSFSLSLALTRHKRDIQAASTSGTLDDGSGQPYYLDPPEQRRFTRETLQAIYQESISRERGTISSFDPEMEGSLADAASAFAPLLRAFDPEPVERVEHFRWLEQPDMTRKGWYARILDLQVAPVGFVAQVKIWPFLVSNLAAITSTNDYFMEYYAFTPLGIEYLGGHGPPDERRMIFGD